MNGTFAQRVRSAAVTGWWTILINMIWMTAAWLLWILLILPCKPSWVIDLWGGSEFLDWQKIYDVFFTFMAVWKLILFVFLMVTIWLSLWARKLKKLG